MLKYWRVAQEIRVPRPQRSLFGGVFVSLFLVGRFRSVLGRCRTYVSKTPTPTMALLAPHAVPQLFAVL